MLWIVVKPLFRIVELTWCALNRKSLATKRNTEVHTTTNTQKKVGERNRGMV